MQLFDEVKTVAERIYGDITGQARADLERALADLEAEVTKVEDVVQTAAADVKAAAAGASPEIQAAVDAALQKLVADLLALFEKTQ
jgi:molecular chaperone GrpE (heat shock protein)